jgi:hypothetical protein
MRSPESFFETAASQYEAVNGRKQSVGEFRSPQLSSATASLRACETIRPLVSGIRYGAEMGGTGYDEGLPAAVEVKFIQLDSMRSIHTFLFSLACGLSAIIPAGASGPSAEGPDSTRRPVSYNHQIRPILSNHCFACHGPDSEHRQADLRLDVSDGVDLDDLVARITADDPDVVMPPPDFNKPLSPTQVSTLKRWVDEDAPYQEHWAFVSPIKLEPPGTAEESFGTHTIDRFVAAERIQRGMSPTPPADKRTLIRRVTMDLIGLPPTRQEIQTFLRDDSPSAFENLVDRLLESPHYGEHQARYWLDLVRFADTNGLHHDHYREMTPYRDWVIRAFNDNLPFSEFTISQIAGDLYPQPTTDQLIASGFNRLHLIIDRGTALPEESFTRNVVDRVSSVGTAFLGLTLECAVCHDHKYDPITQRDFYQLYAFFNNFDGGPETGGRGGLDFRRGLQPPYLDLPSDQQKRELKRLDQVIATLQTRVQEQEELEKQQQAESGDETANPEQTAADGVDETALKQLKEQLALKIKERDQLIESIPATLVMKERAEVRPAHILVRGNYDQPGEPVERNTPGFLPPIDNRDELKTRMDLAKWLVDAKNPLTARVAVNRFWQQIFGVGLVKTSEDFGAQGEPPSHPELLDHLTIEFINSGWDVKRLLRSYVLSQTYRQSSKATRAAFLSDPANRWLARGSRYRYDAEVIRDQVLAVSGLLNTTLYGKSVKPPQPAGLWKIVAMPSSYPRIYEADEGEKIYRRSVYSFWKRGLPPPQMTIFDAPTRESCIARRERTNTPLQALVLMNEQQYFSAAIAFARRLRDQTDLTDAQRIERAYEEITSQLPEEATRTRLIEALSAFRALYRDHPEAASQMLDLDPVRPSEADLTDEEPVELAAMTMLVHSLLNLDATKTRE